MEETRATKFSNQILYNLLLDYSVTDIKILAAMVNRLLSRYKALENEEAESDIDVLEIGVSLDFFKQYKGKSNLTKQEINDILKKIVSFGVQIYENGVYTRISIVNKVQYDIKYNSFKITFNENAMEYLILIQDKFTLIDLNAIKDFSSKYELGLYILISMYKNTGLVIREVEELKRYFNMKCETKILLNNVRNAIDKLNERYKYNIKLEEQKTGKRIDTIRIRFKVIKTPLCSI